jgi:hypothetical protein
LIKSKIIGVTHTHHNPAHSQEDNNAKDIDHHGREYTVPGAEQDRLKKMEHAVEVVTIAWWNLWVSWYTKRFHHPIIRRPNLRRGLI